MTWPEQRYLAAKVFPDMLVDDDGGQLLAREVAEGWTGYKRLDEVYEALPDEVKP